MGGIDQHNALMVLHHQWLAGTFTTSKYSIFGYVQTTTSCCTEWSDSKQGIGREYMNYSLTNISFLQYLFVMSSHAVGNIHCIS